jgi:molecular chaperone DnaK
MKQLSAVGIDLGTTFSSVAIVNNQGVPEIIPNTESERLTPSVVFFDEDSIIVGQIAKDAIITNPDEVVMFAKRQMGDPNWYYLAENDRYDARDISSMILAKLKKDAEAYLGRPLPYAVITVPAYFGDKQRRVTIEAGEIAGFEVLDIINEPTAAAIAFGIDRSQNPEAVLVYDLGGGTFDVTLMKVNGKDITILATDGDHQLGGKDFDDAIMRFAVEQFQNEHGFDPTEDPYVAGDLRIQAEKAKRELSLRSKTMLMVRAKGNVSRISISREIYQDLIEAKLGTTLTLVREVLRQASLDTDQVDRVLLIGGSTRIPAVRDALQTFFGKEPDSSINPDEAVSLGAALVAALKAVDIQQPDIPEPVAEKVGGLQITDVTSHSIGIEAYVPGTEQKINAILIPRNSPIPSEVSKEFLTTQHGQTAIKVTIYSGEFQDPKLCNPVGEFTMSGLPSGRAAGRKVRLTVSCGSNGVVNVSAVDIESGQMAETRVDYKDGSQAKTTSARDRWKKDKTVL